MAGEAFEFFDKMRLIVEVSIHEIFGERIVGFSCPLPIKLHEADYGRQVLCTHSNFVYELLIEPSAAVSRFRFEVGNGNFTLRLDDLHKAIIKYWIILRFAHSPDKIVLDKANLSGYALRVGDHFLDLACSFSQYVLQK